MPKTREMNLTQGNMLKQMIRFALPILAINVLQLLFTTADTAVLGIFVSPEKQTSAVGGVGATNSITNLLIGLFIGIGIGANVTVAKAKGQGDIEKARKAVGSSILISIIAGFFLAIVGFFGARTFLTWMNCKEELLDMATTYLKIYFLAMPIYMFYNYAAAILRAVGETTKPLIYLLIGGCLNVVLNVVCVAFLDMDVDGVALATVASNTVSAICCFITLKRHTGFAKFEFKYFKFNPELKEILYVGSLTGLHKVVFCISNIIVASTLNSFGSAVTAGNAVAHTFDAYINEVGEAFAISVLSFVGQNVGANNYKRAIKSVLTSISIIIVVEATVASVTLIFDEQLCRIISQDDEVIKYAVLRLKMIAPFYVFVAVYSCFSYFLRAIGKSGTATFMGVLGGFFFRIAYIEVVKHVYPGNIVAVYLSYPVTWGVTLLLFAVSSVICGKKVLKNKF